MYSPTMLRINQKKKNRNYTWHHKASLPKQALVMDFSKNFTNYEQQSASTKNICFTSFYYNTEKNMLMFLSSTHD